MFPKSQRRRTRMAAPEENRKGFFISDSACFIISIPEDLDSPQFRRIPTDFVKVFEELFPPQILLKGPSRRPFVVCFSKGKDGTITLEEGWKDFILGNDIKPNEFLLFCRDENRNFNIRVVEPCELENLQATQTYQGTATVVLSDGKKKRGRGRPRKESNPVVPDGKKKQGRGRPRKDSIPVVLDAKKKRGRGRPRKVSKIV